MQKYYSCKIKINKIMLDKDLKYVGGYWFQKRILF